MRSPGRFCLAFAMLIATLALLSNAADAQNLQLAYTNADIAEKLVRSATTTTPPPPTTKKSTFFGGIRNLFSSKKDKDAATGDATTARALIEPTTTTTTTIRPTVVPASTTTTSTTTTARPTTSTTTTTPAAAVHSPNPFGNRPKDPLHDFESRATITLSSTTRKPPTPVAGFPPANNDRDFPALGAPRRPGAGGVLPPSQSPSTTGATTANAWSTTTPKPPAGTVNFVRPSTVRPTIGGPASTARPGTTTTPNPANEATDSELEALTEVLYGKESSLLSLVTVNYQGRTQSSASVDEAPKPLISVNEALLLANPTVAKMKLLYNNYEQDTLINEHVTAMERNEENDFIDALLSSGLMRSAMQFLQQKGKVTPDPRTHRDLLKTIWFSLYSRGRGKIGSSAFEHVFLTELRNGTVSGFHNWIYYYFEELEGRADYQGWLKKSVLGTKAEIVKFRFSYNGVMKPVNALFIGTSPELEMALYTVCFAMRADRECPVSLGGQRLTIRTHTFRYRGKNLIGSAFPEI